MNYLYLENAKDILENLEEIELDIQEKIKSEDMRINAWETMSSFKYVIEDYIEKLEGANNE
jgi:hypothetical protein